MEELNDNYQEQIVTEIVNVPEGNTPADLPTALPPETPPQPAGTLFGAIAYQNVEDIPMFIERMKIQDAAFILVSAATYGHKKGIYSLLESEVVSKAVRVFTMPPPQATKIPIEPEKE